MAERATIFMNRKDAWDIFLKKIRELGILDNSFGIDLSLSTEKASLACDEKLYTDLIVEAQRIKEVLEDSDRQLNIEVVRTIKNMLLSAHAMITAGYFPKPDTSINRALKMKISKRKP